MNKQEAYKQTQVMHQNRLVTKDSIIGWYESFSHKIPKRYPERSLADLYRTMALWMKLTEQGGAPGFPFDYDTNIEIPKVTAESIKLNKFFVFSFLIIFLGVILLFINLNYGTLSIVIGVISLVLNYKFSGGSKNIQTMLTDPEGKKVVEWIKSHSI